MFSSAIQRLNDRRNGAENVGEDAGFTLIELMVVLLILAILLAIAIPTFLGVTKSANDRAAQSNLNTAMLNAKAAYQSNSQTYTGVTVATLTASEPSLNFVSTASTAQNVVSVFPAADGNAIVLASYSKSNNCFYQIDNPGGNTSNVTLPFATNFQMNGVTVLVNTVTTAAAGTITFPASQVGTIYVEVKGDTLASDCSAGGVTQPKVGANAQQIEWTTTQFPSL
jgi:type IV pilus assembly protein PilA